MDAQTAEGRIITKRSQFPWISWGAILGGLFSGMATYFLLTLLGLAVGLSAINPQAAEPVGDVPLMTVIWSGISLVLSAFVGGYVAARMSGLSRLADGILHGLVAWGVSTIVFAYIITTSVGTVLGGAFGALGQGVKAVAGGAVGAVGGVSASPSAQSQLESIIKGAGGGGDISRESIANLQQRLSAGDRDGSINVMVSEMGFTEERATQVVDQGMVLFGQAQQLPQQARDVTSTAVSGIAKASWGMFFGVLLSMGLAIFGGVIGSKATVKRRTPLVL